MNAHFIITTSLLMLLASTGIAANEKPDSMWKQIVITSDSATFFRDNSSAEYIGNVVLKHKDMTLQASKLIVTVEEKEIQAAVAIGDPARVSQEKEGNPEESMKASGKQIVYQVGSDELLITGDAEISSNGSVFKGAELKYNMRDEQIQAESGKQEGGENEQILLVLPLDEEDSNNDNE